MSSRQSLLAVVLAVPCLLVAGSLPALAQPTSEERPVSGFTALRSQRGVDVYLTQGTRESVGIEVDGYKLEDVSATVEDNVLVLATADEGWWSGLGERRVIAHVEFVRLSAITASGGSDIESRNALKLDDLTVQASGGSDIELDVQASSLELTLSGGSDLDLRGSTTSLVINASGGSDASARSMAATRVTAKVSGGSDAVLRATEAIEINASGGSDVQVFGNPAERNVRNDKSSDVIWR